MNREWIQTILPHRDPFLLIDEVIEHEQGVSATAIWNVTGEESFFKGHFPGLPVVPGVLIIEALAQTGAVALLSMEQNTGKVGYLAGVDKTRFRRKVVPGDTLVLKSVVVKMKLGIGYAECSASVNGETAVTAVISFAVS